MRDGGGDAAVDGGDEAEIGVVAYEQDLAGLRQLRQRGRQLRFGRFVVDHDHAARRPLRIGQHRLQASLRLGQAAIGRDDDVDHHAVRHRQRVEGRG